MYYYKIDIVVNGSMFDFIILFHIFIYGIRKQPPEVFNKKAVLKKSQFPQENICVEISF